MPSKSYQVYNILPTQNPANSVSPTIASEGSILVTIYNNTNARRDNSVRTNNTEHALEMGNAWMQPRTNETITINKPITRRITMIDSAAGRMSNLKIATENSMVHQRFHDQFNVRAFSTPPFNTDYTNVSLSRPGTTSGVEQSWPLGNNRSNFKDWARIYLFGSESKTGIPRV